MKSASVHTRKRNTRWLPWAMLAAGVLVRRLHCTVPIIETYSGVTRLDSYPDPRMRATPRTKSLTGLFARAQDALLMPFQAELKSHDLSIVEWRVLKALLAEDGMRIIDLAERALSHQVTITHAIGRMERAGLVIR